MKTNNKAYLLAPRFLILLILILGLIVWTDQKSSWAATSSTNPASIEQVKEILNQSNQIKPLPSGTVNCFDYYKFGSVQVRLESSVDSTVPGVPLSLRGKIINQNNYPIVDGAVYVKVFRKSEDKSVQSNGYDLVDQFFAAEDISLDSQGSEDIGFEWKIPNYAMAGNYQIATFFTSAKKFNLQGLSFTDDVVGNTVDFAVKGNNKAGTFWDKNSVSLNGKKFNFASVLQLFAKNQAVTVKATLKNQTDASQNVSLTWTLYNWDAQQKENMIKNQTEMVQLAPNSSKEVSHSVDPQVFPVSYLVAQAENKDTKSLLNVRFVNKDIQQARLNFPAVTSFPLKKGTETTLFSCLHNSGIADRVENGKLTLSLIDDKGSRIHTYNYSGDITGAMMGVKDRFIPQKDYDNFTLKADLYTGGKLVDSAMMKYDCQKINPSQCLSRSAVSAIAPPTLKNIIYAVLIILTVVLILLILFRWREKIFR